MGKVFPITDVFSKYGFDETGSGSDYAHKVARVLKKHGYAVRVTDAVGHCEYISKVISPKPNRRVLTSEEAWLDPEINKILEREFPFDLEILDNEYLDSIPIPKNVPTKNWDPICRRRGNTDIGWFIGSHPECCGNCSPYIK